MNVLATMQSMGHEQVIFRQDAASGLRVIVAIHSTVLGPALGGTRWYPYPNEAAALEDVLRLSSAMTGKAAIAGLRLGGGKATVIGDPATKTPAQLRAYGRFLETLAGRYLTTTDVGTTTADLDAIRDSTRYVVGCSPERGGSGDTSDLTAVTVINGMRAALRVVFDDEEFAERRIVVLGVGKVGSRIARYVASHGALVTVADVRAEAAAALALEIGARALSPEDALFAECDVLSPNALGGVLSPATIPALRCRVVCGGANNQLLHDPEDAALLAARGILYAPDYAVNSGGVISVGVEHEDNDRARAAQLAARVYDTTLDILRTAEKSGTTTAEIARRRVDDILAGARRTEEG